MPPLAVPRSIRIFQACVKYGIDTALIKHLHMYDLQCLIFQFEIQDVQQYLDAEKRDKMRSQGLKEIKEISGAEAIRFLGR
jgi:hypothetical protein